ncbi:hypothetical protein [Kutzneria sp. 744]|uniref:hypothetical protein n=1 Tax=Kutzneria sp. (strain 744) TaxID=345341 RepID=UPI001E4ED140|nr:hypothetical protein [Kutzneria sp. 744]
MATRPALMSAASFSVAARWLRRRIGVSYMRLMPSSGALPWMIATVRVPAWASVPTSDQLAAPATTGRMARITGSTRARRRSPARQRTISSVRPVPVTTTANPSSMVPPIAASGRNRPSGWPKPTLPHGNPSNGK